jgi:hypothetical protein
MFKMIGGDGREYGPVTVEQLREWIADRRANGQTLVQAEGTTQWTPLGSVPEVAEALARVGGTSVSVAGGTMAAPAAGAGVAGSAWGAPNIPGCVVGGWRLLTRHFSLLTGGAALVWLLLTAGAVASGITGVVSLAVSGVLYGGLALLNLRLIRQQPATITDVFGGFAAGFLSLALVWLITQAASAVGMMFLLAPGIYLKVVWVFGLAVAADQRLGFWAAMETSRRAVARHWFSVAVLVTIAYLPVILFALYSVYETTLYALQTFGLGWRWDQFGERIRLVSEFARKLSFQQHVVLLVNLPLAYAILMHAYEDIFGRRPAQPG